jgi:hypothetical protein
VTAKLKKMVGEPDIQEWEFGDMLDEYVEKYRAKLIDVIQQILRLGFNDDYHNPTLEMPAASNQSIDALTLNLTLDALSTDEKLFSLQTTLREVLADDIKECAEDGSYCEGLARISNALKTLAGEIDSAVKAGAKK